MNDGLICLVCTEKLPVPPVRGGAIQTYIDAVAPILAADTPVVVLCRSDPALPDSDGGGPVRYVRLPAADPREYYRNVADWLALQPPFELVVLFNRPAYALQVARASQGARLALSMHNDMFEPERLSQADGRAILQRVEFVTCVSNYVRRNIERLYPEYQQKLRTVYAGVDTNRFAPDATGRTQMRARLNLPERAPVVLQVSRFSAKKGNRVLLDAFTSVHSRHPQARLLVVGSSRYGTDELDDYGREFRSLGLSRLSGAICFTGFVPPAQVAEYYKAGDLFVVTSQWQEPLARVHYEAMAAGLPVVTTDRGGNCEVVEESASALVARPFDDPASFAHHIGFLLEHPERRAEMGQRGRELAVTRYTWDRVASEWKGIIAGKG